jgi:ubiquinone/menaquinone biosynthesis C-methylase UbiE
MTRDRFQAEAVYDRVAGKYMRASFILWPWVVDKTIALLEIQPGDSVLDVGCGPGAAALEAKRAGAGRVWGVDISTRMLEIARQLAITFDFRDIDYRKADMMALPFHPGSIDRVACIFALPYAPPPDANRQAHANITRAIAQMWRVVRPGGRLAITTVGPDFFSPVFDTYVQAVQTAAHIVVDDELAPWRQTEDPGKLRAMLADTTGCTPRVISDVVSVPRNWPATWWTIVGATGISRIDAELDDRASPWVRDQVDEWLAEHDPDLSLGVNYAIVERPADD